MTVDMNSTIYAYESEVSDLELQITKLSEDKILKHKQSSSQISDIHAKYSVEKDLIRNEIRSLDNSDTNNEYKLLMADLNEVKDNEEREVEAEEDISTDYENELQLQIDELQTRKEAAGADLEGFKETNKENTEKSFKYFD